MDSVTIPTKEQAAALFAEASVGVMPATPKPHLIAQRLAPYGPSLRQSYADGYSVDQLIEILKSPKIGIAISPTALRNYLKKHRRSHKSSPSSAAKSATAVGKPNA
jgi:hypothetical protein